MKRVLGLSLVAVLLIPVAAEAGCRCGQSYISEWKTCHKCPCSCPSCDYRDCAVMTGSPLPMTPKAVPVKKGRKRAGRHKEPEWALIRKISRRVGRYLPDGFKVVTYPGVLVGKKTGKVVETMAFLVDCTDRRICPIHVSECAFDDEWAYTAPGTLGDHMCDITCK